MNGYSEKTVMHIIRKHREKERTKDITTLNRVLLILAKISQIYVYFKNYYHIQSILPADAVDAARNYLRIS